LGYFYFVGDLLKCGIYYSRVVLNRILMYRVINEGHFEQE
jgi:hypothetical protein